MTAPTHTKCTFLSALVMALLCLALTADGQQPTADQEPAIDQTKAAPDVSKLPECSLGKTNESCKLVIDRRNPVAPPNVQMYSDQTLTVIVKNPLFFERYFLDFQTGQAVLTPDVASSIVQGLLPSLAKTQFRTAAPPADPCASAIAAAPTAGHVADVVSVFQDCLSQLARQATDIYRRLEPFVAPASVMPVQNAISESPGDLLQPITAFEKSEIALSSKITTIAGDTNLKNSVLDAPAILQLSNLQKLADAVANDLLGYGQRIAELPTAAGLKKNGFQDCKSIIKVTAAEQNIQCVAITSRRDNERVYQKMVTRTITYSLDALNLVSNPQEAAPDPTKKKLLASVVINFADTPTKFAGIPHTPFRWEASAGVFFSTLPIRSFSVAPVFNNGVITDNTVAQNILRPTVVPFAAANYRLTNDLGWTRWKSDVYWTGAIGVNPNTVSADFATGLSMSWRALMLSALCHFGHDVRLTQGFHNGQSLGPTFNAKLPTQTYWTESFALGVSIRVPSLTGR